MSNVLFCTISHDPITVAYEDISLSLPFRDLERVFPQTVGKLLRDKEITDVVVINGPGSFTSLRIGCVALNTIQMLSWKKYTFRARTKHDLYGVVVQQNLLPNYGIISIGQQKKLRGVSYGRDEKGIFYTCEYITKETSTQIPETYFWEDLGEHLVAEMLDEKNMLQYKRTKEWLQCFYQGKEMVISTDTLMDVSKKTVYLIPEYMIAPQIG